MKDDILSPMHCTSFWPCAPAGMVGGLLVIGVYWVAMRLFRRLIAPDLVAWERRERALRREPPKVCLDCEVGEPHVCEILFDRGGSEYEKHDA